MKKIKGSKGITLIALVITIVVLIILAGVAIALSVGNNGIFTKAKEAKNKYSNSETIEQEQLNELYSKIESDEIFSEGSNYNTKIDEFKIAIAKALTDQKVETSKDDSIETMVKNIEKILEARTSNATVTQKDIATGKTVYANGQKITGTMDNTTEENDDLVILKEKKYLYNNGDECTNLTGGWEKGHNQGYTTLTKNADSMTFYAGNSNYTSCLNTINKVDLTGYSQLYYEVNSNLKMLMGTTTNKGVRLDQASNGYASTLVNASNYGELLDNGHYLITINIQDMIENNQYISLSSSSGNTHIIYAVYLR